MSADYGTKSFKGYHHDGGVYVVWRKNPDDWYSSESEFGFVTPAMVSELQSITDQWRQCSNDDSDSDS